MLLVSGKHELEIRKRLVLSFKRKILFSYNGTFNSIGTVIGFVLDRDKLGKERLCLGKDLLGLEVLGFM